MTMKTKLAAVVVAAGLVGVGNPTSVSAEGSTSPNAVVDWSREAERAIVGVAGRMPGDAAVLMGIVHTAIYDAVVAIEGGGRPYRIRPAVVPGASSPAATAAAAHGVLVGMFPNQRPVLDVNYSTYLGRLPEGAAKADGIAVGDEVAAALLALRTDDGRSDVVPYVQAPPGPGVFEPVAPFTPVGTTLSRVKPLALPHVRVFEPPSPPALDSERYAQDLNETASRGGSPSNHRPEERAILRVWADHGIPQWNRTLFRLIEERSLDILETARFMALAHVSGSDAMITCFAAKYRYLFWRPVHAIRKANTDGNPATTANPTWTPVLGTPNHPEYPAGHNCHSTAVASAIGEYFGTDEVPITVDSLSTGEVRHYDRLSEAADEVVEARILGGVHFRSASEEGAALGAKVAKFVANTEFTRTQASG